MKVTFGILAHVDAGKTTFSEQVLFRSGLIRSLGRVDSGNSFMDCHEVERERGITVFSEQAVYRRGEDTYYLIDTPGHADFSSEMERAMEVLDYGILLVSGTDGIQGHTETIWNLLRKYRIPVFLFINKLDRDTADYEAVLKSLQERFSPAVCDMSFLTDSAGTDGGSVPEQLVMLAAEDHEEILEQYLDNLFAMLLAYGFKNFLFITGHAGNVDTVSYLCKKYMEMHNEIHCGQIDWWRFTGANGDDIFDNKGPMAHGHASECGTSVMLYLRPELVHMEDASCVQSGPASQFPDIIQYSRFIDRTHNGTIGDATAASAEKGEKIVKRCVDKIVAFMSCEFK